MLQQFPSRKHRLPLVRELKETEQQRTARPNANLLIVNNIFLKRYFTKTKKKKRGGRGELPLHICCKVIKTI